MTDVVLVRHGETVWHAENRYAGSSDVELTEHGLEQARYLAGWAKGARLSAIWSSPQSRALRTARAAATVTDLDVHIDDRLRELDFGAAEGLTSAGMRERFPAELDAFHRDPVTHHLPGGEHPAAGAARFVECLDEIVERHPGQRVLVVAHTTAIRLALCTLLGIPLSDYRLVLPFIRNCAVTELRREPGTPTALLEYNTPIEPV